MSSRERRSSSCPPKEGLLPRTRLKMPNTTALRLLLLSADPFLVSTFVTASAQLGIEVESSKDRQQVSDQVSRSRYEAVVLDFDTVPDAGPVLASVRESRSNKNAVVFVVATDQATGQVLLDRAQFLLRRPIETRSVKKTLNAAYEFMRGERRRYFRCAVDFPVTLRITDSGNVIECVAINVSSEGVAVDTPIPLKPGETVDIALHLPHESVVHLIGLVIWDDQHGKSGLHFQRSGAEMRYRLDSWLDSQFVEKNAQL